MRVLKRFLFLFLFHRFSIINQILKSSLELSQNIFYRTSINKKSKYEGQKDKDRLKIVESASSRVLQMKYVYIQRDQIKESRDNKLTTVSTISWIRKISF